MYQRIFPLFILFSFLAACSSNTEGNTVNATINTRTTPVTQLSAEQENQRRKLAQSFTVANMHLGMGYVQAKTAVLNYAATIDEQDKPFRLKEADSIDRQAAFYDQRYATLTNNFYVYYGKHSIDYLNGTKGVLDRVSIRADFVPAMVWDDNQPLYLYRVSQAICTQTEEELNRIISATLEKYGRPDDIIEIGPKKSYSADA